MGKAKYYFGLITVILIWGISPNITNYLLNFYSAPIQNVISSIVSICAMFIICRKKLKLLNADYFKVAIPTGIFYSLAIIAQKIGLTMTTPTRFAFLENVSCITTPLFMLLLIKQKISLWKFLSGGLCMLGIYFLCGGMGDSMNFGMGEFLCALAGVLYSVNIVGTAVYAKKFDVTLYLLVQFAIHGTVSVIFTLLTINDITMSLDIKYLLLMILTVLISTVLGWIIRTICLKHLDPSFVAVAMPFSAAITSIISIIAGTDSMSFNLVLGSLIILASIIISGLADARYIPRKNDYT